MDSATVMLDIINTLRDNVADYNTRRNIYADIIDSFDTQGSSMGGCLGEDDAFDEAWDIIYPQEYDDIGQDVLEDEEE